MDRKRSTASLKDENIEFAIEFLNNTSSSTTTNTPENKILNFEATTMHDRKLWLQKLKEALGKYQEKVDLEKTRKYSGT